ncbi:MAG: adenylosuccinate lyase [Actinomycetota bacterium]|nr:adenylosuccinate lyase [Actinomycetota bacterium]
MIERYTLPAIGALFSDSARMKNWLAVEYATVEALTKVGVVPSSDFDELKALAPNVDDAFVEAVNDRELITNHDLAAFVDVVQTSIATKSASWIHYGLTSSDVVDTALSLTLKEAGKRIRQELVALIEAIHTRAVEHSTTIMAGRTHGMHAEPTTFGNKLALFGLSLSRDLERLDRAIAAVSVGKLSGAVGTYSNIDPAVESYVCELLGITPVPATQVIARDRHAEYLYSLTSLAATIETIATEVRHLARTEVGEAEEYFAPGQKGSSAMPHKRNPILSERLVGLSRVMRGYLISGLEDVALWHERDISHSSVERIVLSDASILAYYMVNKAKSLVSRLMVYPDRMRQNLDDSFGFVFSQSLLLTLVDAGMSRDEAYRIVQRSARVAYEQRKHLRTVIEEDESVNVSDDLLDRAFSVERVTRHCGRAIDELSKLVYVQSAKD